MLRQRTPASSSAAESVLEALSEKSPCSAGIAHAGGSPDGRDSAAWALAELAAVDVASSTTTTSTRTTMRREKVRLLGSGLRETRARRPHAADPTDPFADPAGALRVPLQAVIVFQGSVIQFRGP